MQKIAKRRYDSFDFLKGLACIAVVLIHYNYPGTIGLAVKTYCRFAVPVFFFISGFFLLKNGQIDDVSLYRKLRHIMRLIIGSACLYATLEIVWSIVVPHSQSIASVIEQELDAGSIVRFFVSNDPFIYSHLWFLMALLYCYLTMLLFFHQPGSLKLVKFLAPLLLIGYSCLQEFHTVIGGNNSLPIFGTAKQVYLFNIFIFRALPFVFFGILARQYEEKLIAMPVSRCILIIGAVMGGLLSIGERLLLGQESQFYIGSYITVACMVLWALKTPEGGWKPLVFVGRNLSLYVYIFHVAVAKCMNLFAGKLRMLGTPVYAIIQSPMVLVLSLCAAYVMLCIQKWLESKKRIEPENAYL